MKGHIPGPRAGPGPARAGPRQAAALFAFARALAPSARSQRIFYRVYIARTGHQGAVFSKAYIAPKNIIYFCAHMKTWSFHAWSTTSLFLLHIHCLIIKL